MVADARRILAAICFEPTISLLKAMALSSWVIDMFIKIMGECDFSLLFQGLIISWYLILILYLK